MVALRDTHEASFDFEQWAHSLDLPEEQKSILQKCHLYTVERVQRKNQTELLKGSSSATQPEKTPECSGVFDSSAAVNAAVNAAAASAASAAIKDKEGSSDGDPVKTGTEFAGKILDTGAMTNLSAEIVSILMELNMDLESLLVAFLYPAYEQGAVDPEEVETIYGKSVRKLMLKVKDMEAICFLQNLDTNEVQVDRVRRMLLSMVDDVRAVVIKLAERIAVIRAAKYADEVTKFTVAREIANIYAPLANRLGIGQLKWELEDMAFRFLHNDSYKNIAKSLGEKRVERERYIQRFVAELKFLLKQNGVDAEVYGRPKHIYSIWRKMQRKHLPFSEIYDVRAVRVVVKKIEDCYTALSAVHSRWEHIDKEFDDYISNPKPNGYQSIHTVVYGDGHKVVEVQFRTEEMHNMAELGVAAHWKYKEGGGLGSGVEQRINWLRKLLAWRDDMVESGALMDEYRKQVFEDRVYVFTPKGEVVDLQAGSTPLDFAYQVHTMIGHRCIGAKIDGRIVPYTYRLKTGDQVEIITQKEPNPSRDWINADNGYLRTSRARSKVISWFRKVDYDKNAQAGSDILEREVLRHGIGLNKDQVSSFLKEKLARFQAKSVSDIYAGIGAGDIKLNQIISFLEERVFKRDAASKDSELQKLIREKAGKSGFQIQTGKRRNVSGKGKIVIDGLGNVMTHIAKCCQPIPGDEIAGFITVGRGVSVHKKDCVQLKGLAAKNPERLVQAHWGEDADNDGFTVSVRVVALDYAGLLRDVTTVIANEKINVLGVRSHTDSKKDLSVIDIDLMLVKLSALSRVIEKLKELKQVRSAVRL